MLTIRLARMGRKNAPSFRLVISEKGRDTFGHSLEILGHYHPTQENIKEKLIVNKERIEHWLKQGAQTSNTVHNLLIDAGLIKGEKKRTIGRYKSAKQLTEEAEASKVSPESGKKPTRTTEVVQSGGEAKDKDAPETSSSKDEADKKAGDKKANDDETEMTEAAQGKVSANPDQEKISDAKN